MRLSTWMPFARAASELARLRGVRVAGATARGRTEAAGAAAGAVHTAELERRERGRSTPPNSSGASGRSPPRPRGRSGSS